MLVNTFKLNNTTVKAQEHEETRQKMEGTFGRAIKFSEDKSISVIFSIDNVAGLINLTMYNSELCTSIFVGSGIK